MDDAVAGHDDGGRVCAAGIGDGAGRFGASDGARQLSVRAGLAGRDIAQRCPDLALEGRRTDVGRQIRVRVGAVEEAQHSLNPFRKPGMFRVDSRRRVFVVEEAG